MKSLPFLILKLLIIGITFNTIGQTPYAFKYQTIIRDPEGNPILNQSLGFRISIIEEEISGDAIFIETHDVQTSLQGLVNIEIGKGSIIEGSFNSIEWGNSVFFLQIEIDLENNGTFELMGTSQLLSVPYALFAENAANPDHDWNISGDDLYAATTGNVGIGSLSPTEKLHVMGSIKTSDTIKFDGSLSYGQLLIESGDIKLGYNQSSYGNILLGNSLYGKTIFDLDMTGGGNIGIGTDVFHETTTANANICLGMYSGYNLTTGSNNLFFGSSAGEHISVGNFNICLGNQSGNGRNGEKNIFIGDRAGYAWGGSGSENIMIGNGSGYLYGASNSGNVFIGNNAGYEVAENDNIFIGPLNTGRNSSGTKNIFLGYEVGKNFIGSSFLLIDHENDNVAPFIKGDMENDELEINADLTVKGSASMEDVSIQQLMNLSELIDFPLNPSEGDLIYLNDTIRFYNGATWRNLW
jgi:hypothetical protein